MFFFHSVTLKTKKEGEKKESQTKRESIYMSGTTIKLKRTGRKLIRQPQCQCDMIQSFEYFIARITRAEQMHQVELASAQSIRSDTKFIKQNKSLCT